MPADDRKLIAGFLTGEPGAVAQMERWVAAAAKPYRARLGGEWEDLRQDVMLELTRLFSEGRFRGESAVVSYVWRVANNACLKRIRSLSRWAPDVTELLQRTKDGRRTADERLVEESRMESIRRLVERMPAECIALWRRILAGQSYPSMAAELSIAEGTLRVRVLRCRQKAMEMREQEEGNKGNK
ncbi:MAG: sigma-70 family RNA polymerase sigma factor [Bryobacterales bacterium]|nr:sigma-70 family RNA polymerase sigma factor [Bryobacterales bacterium]